EVLVEGRGMLDAGPDSFGQVASVGIVPDLVSGAEDVQRVLSLEHLLSEIGNDVRHGELHIAAIDVVIMQGPLLSDADAVEWPDDGVGELVLFPRALHEVLGGKLLEAVGRTRRRATLFRALGSWILRRALEDHAGRHHRDLLQFVVFVGMEGGVEGGGGDALVFRQQVVGELMEIADAADHRGASDKVVAVGKKFLQQVNVLAVGFDEFITRMFVVGLLHPTVLAEVVEAYDVVTGLEEFFDQITADKTGRTSYQYLHE